MSSFDTVRASRPSETRWNFGGKGCDYGLSSSTVKGRLFNRHAGLSLLPRLARPRTRQTIQFFAFFLPLLVFALAFASAEYPVRISLFLHGRPFAVVVPKTSLNVFKFVPVDLVQADAIVFSNGKPVGWIEQPNLYFARFVPFSGKPTFDDSGSPDLWFDIFAPLAWNFRWWLLVLQVVILLLWFFVPSPPQHGFCLICGYDLRATPDRCPECGTVPKQLQLQTDPLSEYSWPKSQS